MGINHINTVQKTELITQSQILKILSQNLPLSLYPLHFEQDFFKLMNNSVYGKVIMADSTLSRRLSKDEIYKRACIAAAKENPNERSQQYKAAVKDEVKRLTRRVSIFLYISSSHD
jgi:hypothetical protein